MLATIVVGILVFLSSLQPWDGFSPINNVEYPSNIEQVWTTAQLNAIGLCRVSLFTPPNGQVTTGSASYINNGNGTCSQTFATTAAPIPPASRLQWFETLAQNSEFALANSWVNGQSAFVQFYWANTPQFQANDIVILRLMVAENWTVPQVASYFTEAANWTPVQIP